MIWSELPNTPRFHFKAQVFAQPPGTVFIGKFVADKKTNKEFKDFIAHTLIDQWAAAYHVTAVKESNGDLTGRR